MAYLVRDKGELIIIKLIVSFGTIYFVQYTLKCYFSANSKGFRDNMYILFFLIFIANRVKAFLRSFLNSDFFYRLISLHLVQLSKLFSRNTTHDISKTNIYCRQILRYLNQLQYVVQTMLYFLIDLNVYLLF